MREIGAGCARASMLFPLPGGSPAARVVMRHTPLLSRECVPVMIVDLSSRGVGARDER